MRYPLDRIPERITPEDVHLFELCPKDWELAAWFSGYRAVFTRLYRQYPRRGFLRMMAPVWRSLDFEGFACLFLVRDLSLAERYTGW
jgi:hypothetical protein